jgi:hypothetical protein
LENEQTALSAQEASGQKKFEYAGEEVSVETVDAEIEKLRKEQAANSMWRQIDDGKIAKLGLTKKIFKRNASFEGGASLKFEFELVDKTPDGKNKVFSTGSKSKVCQNLVKIIKEHPNDPIVWVFVSRKGVGKATSYEVSEPE